ncbi:MAG: T9SS type A sorting domain-containing protein [Deferribacteres bacterium]|nr:T9SS type A sorting domain-containing protein [Deferribacteres bacterium]
MTNRLHLYFRCTAIFALALFCDQMVSAQLIEKPGLWQSFGPFQAEVRINKLQQDSERPGTLYASSGTLYKSTNYGLQWQALPSPESADLLLIVGGRIFVANASDLFFSDDEGMTWQNAGEPIQGTRINGIKRIGNTLFATSNSKGIFFSTDLGNTWTQANSPMHNTSMLNVIASRGALFSYSRNAVFSSTNNGLDWSKVNFAKFEQGLNTVYAADNVLIACVINDSLYRSENDGTTWKAVQALNGPWISEIKEVNGRLYTFGYDNLGRTSQYEQFFASSDNGQTWTNLEPNIQGAAVTKLVDAGGTLVAGTFSRGIYVSGDNGSSWSRINLPVQEFSAGVEISTLEFVDGTLYAASYDRGEPFRSMDQGSVFISTDNGWHWRKSVNGLSAKLPIHDLVVDANFVMAARLGNVGTVYHSPDLGQNWVQSIIPEALFWPTKIWKFNGNILISNDNGGGGDLRISKDGGASWTSGSLSPEEMTSINGILFGVLYGTVFQSFDGGSTWSELPNQPAASPTSLTIAAYDGGIYCGMLNAGVYHSTDGGQNWQQAAGPISTQTTKFIVVDSQLFAATQDAGLFQKTALGWTQAQSPLDAERISAMAKLNNTLFATTSNSIFTSTDGLHWNIANLPGGNMSANSIVSAADRIFLGTEKGAYWTDDANSWYALQTGMQNIKVNKLVYLPVFNRLYSATDDGVFLQVLDTSPPTADSLIINNQSPFADSPAIDLILIADEDADSMIVSESPDFADANWQLKNPFRSFVLSNGDGAKTVYAKFKDISSNESSVIAAQIILDQTDPNFTPFPHTPPQNVNPNTLVTISQQVDESNLANMMLRFRRVGESFNNSSRMVQFTNNSATIDSAWVRNKGIDYQVIATDQAGRSTTLPNGTLDFFSLPINIGAAALGTSRSLPGGSGGNAYRIVSVPMQMQNAPQVKDAFRSLGKYGRRGDWRAWSYDGDNQWQEGENLELQTGTAVFMLRRNGGSLTNAASGVTTKTSDGVLGTIPGWQLRAGDWTLIGNPYNTRLALNQLMLKSDSTRLSEHGTGVQVWGYDGRWRNPQTDADLALEPWSGVFVRAPQTDTIVFADSKEPYAQPVAKSQPRFADSDLHVADDEWRVQITATAGEFSDDLNFFGVKKDADERLDDLDWYEPPFLPGGIGLSFPHDDWDDAALLTADFRPLSSDGQSWQIAVVGAPGSAVQLNFAGLESVPETTHLLLVDETTRIVRDLRKEQALAVRIPSDAVNKQLTILAGTEAFIRQNTAGLLAVPTEFLLEQNYPNPFNPATTIRYALPVAGEVSIKIYDLMGNEMLVLDDRTPREAGYYEQVADMARFGSGVYFYRIIVDGMQRFQSTRKMILVK